MTEIGLSTHSATESTRTLPAVVQAHRAHPATKTLQECLPQNQKGSAVPQIEDRGLAEVSSTQGESRS